MIRQHGFSFYRRCISVWLFLREMLLSRDRPSTHSSSNVLSRTEIDYIFIFLVLRARFYYKQAVGGRPSRYARTLSPWEPKRLAPPSRRQRSSSFPRPTRSHAHRCICLTHQHGGEQSGLVTLTLKVVSESRVTWATYVPILVFQGLSICSRLRPDVRDRETDVSIIALCPRLLRAEA